MKKNKLRRRYLAKTLLPLAFDAGSPPGKKDFLRKISTPRFGFWHFLGIQAAYISKSAWLMSAAVAAAALLYGAGLWGGPLSGGGAGEARQNLLWMFSALTPALALFVAVENVRSELYGMAELELASRFSLKSIVLARMELLGGTHFVLLCLLSLLCGADGRIFQTAVYIFVPYLITAAGSLRLVRRIRGRDAIYACAALAAAVSLVPVQSSWQGGFNLYKAEYFVWWTAAFVAMAGVTIAEYRRRIAETEEMETEWNLL